MSAVSERPFPSGALPWVCLAEPGHSPGLSVYLGYSPLSSISFVSDICLPATAALRALTALAWIPAAVCLPLTLPSGQFLHFAAQTVFPKGKADASSQLNFHSHHPSSHDVSRRQVPRTARILSCQEKPEIWSFM